MRRLLSMLSAVLLVGAAPAAVAAPSDALVVATVTGTSDAATLDLQLDSGATERVQLVGILPDASDGTAVCAADAAIAQEQQLLAQGPVTFEPADVQPSSPDADAVGYLWLADGRNLGEVLLRQGQARAMPDSPHARSQQFAAAQSAAIADRVGIWAPGACAGATDASPSRGALATFVISSMNTVQQARTGVSVLTQQVASAPQVGTTASWQRTTSMAIGWMRGAAHTFENNSTRADPGEPERGELAALGQQLDASASAAEAAVAAGDTAQLQALAPQLDAANLALIGVASELNGLAVAYTLGD